MLTDNLSNNGSEKSRFFCDNIQGSIIFTVETAVIAMLTVGSLILNYIFLKVLLSSGGHLPLNTKLLLIHCTIAAIGKSFGFVFETIYHICLLTLGFEALAMNRVLCIIIQIPYAISSIALLSGMIFIGFERLWSTWNKNLSDIESTSWRIIFAQIMVWFGSFVIYALEMLVDQDLVQHTVCYCYFPIIMSPAAGVFTNVIFIGTQTLNIVIYFFVYCKNKNVLFQFTMNTAQHSLSERFVMWSNVKASKMLLPISLVDAITYDIIIIINYSLRSTYSKLTDGYLNITLFNHCVLICDTVLQPILLLRYNNALKDIAQTTYPKLYRIFGAEKPELNVHQQMQLSGPKSIVSVREQRSTNSNAGNTAKNSVGPSTCLGDKNIVDFRIRPEHHQDMLKQMWEGADTKKSVQTNRKIK